MTLASIDMLYELVVADSVCESFPERQWPTLELADMYGVDMIDLQRKYALPPVGVTDWAERFVVIKNAITAELASRYVAIVQRQDEGEDYYDDRDYDWEYGIDSDPYDVDRDGPGF